MSHGFFEVVTTERFRELLRSFAPLGCEETELIRACGRVLAEDVTSAENLPLCTRSSMDGYCVRAADTFGAGEANPAYLECVGRLRVNEEPELELEPGQCAAITTGGCLPGSADAVVMVEHTQEMEGGTVEVRKSLAPGDNTMLRGEDVAAGTVALSRGTRLRPQEIGLLAAIGRERVNVFRRPRVAVLSTGDELVEVSGTPRPGQVRDVNTAALSCLVAAVGAEVLPLGLVPDRLEELNRAMARGLEEADVLFLSGGSSVGVRDLTTEAVASFEDSEILAHGVQISPGKPTILARVGERPVFGLPGQVTSAQVVMHVFGLPFLRHLQGEAAAFDPATRPVIRAKMARNVASRQGREDYVRVRLEPREGKPPLAHPLLGKSGLLKTLVRAQGLVTIGARREGLDAGTIVDVWLL